MMEQYECHDASIIGVQHVSEDEVSRYGIVDGYEIEDRLYNINHVVEKPKQEDAPSNLAIMGRYILTPRIFEILNNQKPGAGGEIQLTDAIAELNRYESVYAYEFMGTRYDVGEKMGFIQTTIEYALQRDDLRYDLLKYLSKLMEKELIK
jgi:UTP--glucose-1-phosphate uridylyltransferase